MAIHHASSGELINIRPLNGELASAITKALYKLDRLEIFRTILLAGRKVPPHRMAGEITVYCVEGHVEFTFGETNRSMRGGDLLCLAGSETHALKAVEDSSVVVTILQHGA